MKFLLQKFEQDKINEINASRDLSNFQDFEPGDTVSVGTKIAEGASFRVQNFEGVCLAKYSRGLRTSFLVRKISAGNEGVEKKFMLYLSEISYVKVIRKGVVNRAKIYYISKLSGKSARIKERRMK